MQNISKVLKLRHAACRFLHLHHDSWPSPVPGWQSRRPRHPAYVYVLPGPICPIDCKQERNIITERQKDIVVVLISSMPLLCVLSLVRVIIADEEKVIFLWPWGSSKFYLVICIIYVYYIYILDQLYIYIIHIYIYLFIICSICYSQLLILFHRSACFRRGTYPRAAVSSAMGMGMGPSDEC